MKLEYYLKYRSILPINFFTKKKINILEFGVDKGHTTKLFLELCSKNKGHLISVDIKDRSKLFRKKNWKFIQSRDLELHKLRVFFKKNSFDIICLDTVHTKNHVQKMLKIYFKYLKIGGVFLIDGISHIPYLKDSYRNNFYSEINNQEIFNYLLSLLNHEKNYIDLMFNFKGSGVALIKKNKNVILSEKIIISRLSSVKNIIRKLFFRYF